LEKDVKETFKDTKILEVNKEHSVDEEAKTESDDGKLNRNNRTLFFIQEN
jgi:hypothetical protein